MSITRNNVDMYRLLNFIEGRENSIASDWRIDMYVERYISEHHHDQSLMNRAIRRGYIKRDYGFLGLDVISPYKYYKLTNKGSDFIQAMELKHEKELDDE